MEFIIIFTTILFHISLAIGVGASTLAIINFFVAVANGKISSDEKRMLGVTYIVLRVAMILILITTLILVSLNVQQSGLVTYTPSVIATWILLLTLYVNAILMALQIIPNAFGPSVQAGTWYTFIIMTTLTWMGIFFTVTQFIVVYVFFILFVTLLVNGVMMFLEYSRTKERNNKSAVKTAS